MTDYYKVREDGLIVRVDLEDEGWTPPQEPEPNPIDWNRYKGCLVEVGDNGVDWMVGELNGVYDGERYSIGTLGWKNIRLPEHLTLSLLPHDESDQCPVDDPEQLIVYLRYGWERPYTDIVKGVGNWDSVTAYLPIDFVLPE